MRRALAGVGALGAVAAALALAGCGLVAGSAPSGVQLLVTRDFGSRVLRSAGGLRASAGESVLELLRRYATVGAGPGGSAVETIDGLPGVAQAGAAGSGEWSYYVNGVLAPGDPAATGVHPGDHVWWDLHDTSRAAEIPAVVGSFPEPFLNGIEGKRLPVRVECASTSSACGAVTASLQSSGVLAAVAAIGSGSAPETLRVMVGPWSRLDSDVEAAGIARGPGASGVYARFSAGGRALTLLDEQGRAVRTLSGDAGLIAATKAPREAPVWVITGTDDAGVELAARAFKRSTLADRFAVALEPTGAIALPMIASGAG